METFFYVLDANLCTKSREPGRKLILFRERKLWIFLVVKQLLRWLEQQWAPDWRSALQATQKLIKTRAWLRLVFCVCRPPHSPPITMHTMEINLYLKTRQPVKSKLKFFAARRHPLLRSGWMTCCPRNHLADGNS
jgi:hypothetical protein